MSNPYLKSKEQTYCGEHFKAVYHERAESGQEWTIWQLEPLMWIAQTSSRFVAIELVNRLDSTGEYKFGEDW